MPHRFTPLTAALMALIALALPGCGKPQPAGPAQAGFDAIVAACTQFLAARAATVAPGPGAGEWIKTGYSPALVQGEVTRTDSAVTPYVGKIVVKDNKAQASASAQEAAAAITLTPAHPLSHRTHTFIYSFDGNQWRWHNGLRLTKMPGHNDTTQPLALRDVSASGSEGFSGCVPRQGAFAPQG